MESIAYTGGKWFFKLTYEAVAKSVVMSVRLRLKSESPAWSKWIMTLGKLAYLILCSLLWKHLRSIEAFTFCDDGFVWLSRGPCEAGKLDFS